MLPPVEPRRPDFSYSPNTESAVLGSIRYLSDFIALRRRRVYGEDDFPSLVLWCSKPRDSETKGRYETPFKFEVEVAAKPMDEAPKNESFSQSDGYENRADAYGVSEYITGWRLTAVAIP